MLASSVEAYSFRMKARAKRAERDEYIYGLPLAYFGLVE